MRSCWFLLVMATVCAALAAPAMADGPGVGTPTVVTLGDSAISGEAGRWAGNTNDSYTKADALGSTAYWDTPSGEAISGCHRSKAAQAHIGGGVASANLACSGAKTSTGGTGSGEDFKPGIDFYSDAQGRKGQALALQGYAATHNVKAVVVMIGANNYGFADIVQQCVTNWLTSPSWWKNYCSDDSDMTSRFTAVASGDRDDQRQERAAARRAGDDERRLLELAVHDHRPDVLVADPARLAASATRRAAGRARTSAAAASGTATPTGPTTRSSRRSPTR